MIARNCLRRFSMLLLIGALHGFALAQDSTNALEDGFRNPPDSAKPRVWCHWLNGNVTKEGITADLEWMKRVNIAGMQMFDGNLNTPVFVDKKLVWMTPEWKDAFRHAGAEADRLGLEMAMAASGGWSETPTQIAASSARSHFLRRHSRDRFPHPRHRSEHGKSPSQGQCERRRLEPRIAYIWRLAPQP